MVVFRSSALALATAFVAFAASAQTQASGASQASGSGSASSAPAASAPTKTAHNGYDPNEVVCKWIEETGSRLGNHKVCLTRFDWDQQSDEARDRMNDFSTRQTDSKGWGN